MTTTIVMQGDGLEYVGLKASRTIASIKGAEAYYPTKEKPLPPNLSDPERIVIIDIQGDGEGMRIVWRYASYDYNAYVWEVAFAPLDCDIDFPNWPIQIEPIRDDGSSPRLQIEIPSDAVFQQYTPTLNN